VTYEGVTPVHLTQLKGLARAGVITLVGIVLRRVSRTSYIARDWCLSHASLFDVSQFPEYLIPSFSLSSCSLFSFYVIGRKEMVIFARR
jgi:hypothetical protein